MNETTNLRFVHLLALDLQLPLGCFSLLFLLLSFRRGLLLGLSSGSLRKM
jgi:hypothetical protein